MKAPHQQLRAWRLIRLLGLTWTVVAMSSAAYAAEALITLPLGGHYRIGRFMPVRVEAPTGVDHAITLLAQGAAALEIYPTTRHVSGIFPWLSIRSVSRIEMSDGQNSRSLDLPLEPLEEDQRLVGYVGADPDVVAPLFPGKHLVRTSLDGANPLPGDIAAWFALDGLVLDAAAAQKITESQVQALLAEGTVIAIRSTRMPGGGWPWKHVGDFWIAKVPFPPPVSAFSLPAYDPTQAWPRGWPASFRRQAGAASLAIALLILAAALLPARAARWGVMGMSIVLVAGLLLWRWRQTLEIQTGGAIIVQRDGARCMDDWTYHAVLRPAEIVVPWRSTLLPIFGDREQASRTHCRLICQGDGVPIEWRARLQVGYALATVQRMLSPQAPSLSLQNPISSPLRPWANDHYAVDGNALLGQLPPTDDDHWPDVVVGAAKQ